MTCRPGHKGPANVHVHTPVIVRVDGQPAARLCACGEGFDLDGRPVAALGTKRQARVTALIRRALADELERQGMDVPDELTDD